MFSGIGGFELGIQRAALSIWNREAENTESITSEQSVESTTESLQPNRNITDVELGRDTGKVSCVGYSEIDKYAIKVYERHFNGNTGDKCTDAICGQTKPNKDMLQVRQRETISALSRDNSRIGNVSENGGSVSPTDIGRIRTICNECGRQKGHRNYGDATTINPTELPDFDLLVGGFPCQAFSIAGKRKGFDDTRGTLFFDIARILAEKRPRHLVLENVKGLLSHDSGKTFQTILGVLSDLGYRVEWQVLNSKDFGVPQNRERIYIVGHLGNECSGQVFPITGSSQQIASVAGYISEEVWPRRHEQIRRTYNTDGAMPTIPTGQGGGVMTKIYQQPRIRRLTPKECERLQGFPDDWTALDQEGNPISNTQRYKMCGNAVTVNVVQAVMTNLIKHMED